MSRVADTPLNSQKRKTSGFAQFKALLSKDLRREMRTKEMFVSMLIYAVLVILVYGLAIGFARVSDGLQEVVGGLLWAMVIFTSLLGLNRSFAQEKENGCIEGLLLAPMDRGVVFLAKATSNLLFLLIVEVVAVPLFWFFFSGQIGLSELTGFIPIPLLLGSIGIAGVGTLLSTITANTRGKDVLLALLFIPVVFPLLYACVSATTALLVGGDVADTLIASLALAGGYDVIMLLLSWLLYQFVMGE